MPDAPSTVILIRRSLAGAGGAERVFKKYLAALTGANIQSNANEPKYNIIPVSESETARKKLFGWFKTPGWLRALEFTKHADALIASNPSALSISLERGPSAQIFRAGDGAHRHYRGLLSRRGLFGWTWIFNPLHWVYPHLDEKSLRAARVVIANSKMVAEQLRTYYPWATPKIRVIVNGFDPQKFCVSAEPKQEIRKRLGLPEEGPLFLFMGNGWRRKGLKETLEILRLFEVEMKGTNVFLSKPFDSGAVRQAQALRPDGPHMDSTGSPSIRQAQDLRPSAQSLRLVCQATKVDQDKNNTVAVQELLRSPQTKKTPSPALVIVGKGRAKNLPRNVIYRGLVDNMPDYYRAADAFILPTLYDPFTSSVLEALACGTPVVTTRQNGASEVVKLGETGFLMRSQNEDLREAAQWLAEGVALPPEKIAETVAAYTLEHEIGAIKKIFEEVKRA